MIVIALLAAAAVVPVDEPRRTDAVAISTLSLVELQTCMTRRMASVGRVTPIPLAAGVALDFSTRGGPFANPGKAPLTFEIHDVGETRRLTVAYRHPYSAKTAVSLFRDIGKRCFPEASTPAT